MTPLLVGLVLGCGPSAGDVAAWLDAGEVDRAVDALVTSPPRGMERAAAVAADLAALRAERDAVHAAETELLVRKAEAALARGDVLAGVSAWAIGAVDPNAPELATVRTQVLAALEAAPPELAARGYGALAELPGPDAAEWAERARVAELRVVWADPAAALAAAAGATVVTASEVLTELDPLLVDAPDWSVLGAAGDAAVRRLQATPEAVAAVPALASVGPRSPSGPTVADAREAVGRVAEAARAAGAPEDLLVATWVDGAVGSFDPWTRVVWPAELTSWQAFHDGVQVGVGLRLALDADGAVVVEAPELGGPLWESGVHQGDRVVRLSDDTFELIPALVPTDLRLDAVQGALAGPPGTWVRIDLRRPDGTVGVVVADRAPVVRETVRGFRRGPDNAWSPWLDEDRGLVYVAITVFRESSEPAFDALIEPVVGRARGVVLDLRGNVGGDVDAAVQIADRFLAEGTLVRLDGRQVPDLGPAVDPESGEVLIPWNEAIPGGPLEGVPVVVLVDADTASAAEVLAGALAQLGGARVVGVPTWGKGLSQVLRVDPDGAWAFQATNLVWSLPDGRRLVRGSGIPVDVPLTLTPAERYQIGQQAEARGRLVAHADGAPFVWPALAVDGALPVLSDDPALLVARLLLEVAEP